MKRPRKTPYTKAGIGRVPCMRCGAPSTQQWQICSDGNQFRGVCTACDIALNAHVLIFMKVPQVAIKMANYRKKMEKEFGPVKK